MLKFYDPETFFKNITDPARIFLKDDKKDTPAPVSTAAEDKAKEDAAAAEAAKAARADFAKRTGTAATALSPLKDISSLGTKRRTLGSSA